MRDSKLGLLPKYRKLFGSNTAMYFRPGYHARGDGIHGAGGRLPRQFPRGPRGTHLMGLLDRYRQAPPSVSGRRRHDIVTGHRRCLGFGAVGDLRRDPEDEAAAATWTASSPLTVVDRQVVAHDQDVVALTLASPTDVRCRAGIPARTSTFTCPAVGCGSTRCAEIPATPDTYRIAVRRIIDGGGGSIEVHDDLPVGATVTTHGPRNAFPLTVPGYGSPARRFRFIAGGIGITPILPMLGARRSASASTGRWCTPAAAATACRSSTR